MQKDLFGAAPAAVLNDATLKMSFLDRTRMTVRLDQAVFLMIGLVVAYVLVFSFGVEKGKRYAMDEIRAERQKRERIVEELRDKVFSAQSQALPPIGELQKAVAPAAEKAVASTPVQTAVGTPVSGAAAPPAAIVKPAGKYTIQIMTITSKETAEKEVRRLAQKGHKGFIIPRGKMQEICVEAFESREQASQTLKQLKTTGIVPNDAYVRPLAA